MQIPLSPHHPWSSSDRVGSYLHLASDSSRYSRSSAHVTPINRVGHALARRRSDETPSGQRPAKFRSSNAFLRDGTTRRVSPISSQLSTNSRAICWGSMTRNANDYGVGSTRRFGADNSQQGKARRGNAAMLCRVRVSMCVSCACCVAHAVPKILGWPL